MFEMKDFDLLFNDLEMLGMSGWKVAEKIKAINGIVSHLCPRKIYTTEFRDDSQNAKKYLTLPYVVKTRFIPPISL